MKASLRKQKRSPPFYSNDKHKLAIQNRLTNSLGANPISYRTYVNGGLARVVYVLCDSLNLGFNVHDYTEKIYFVNWLKNFLYHYQFGMSAKIGQKTFMIPIPVTGFDLQPEGFRKIFNTGFKLIFQRFYKSSVIFSRDEFFQR